MQEGCGIVEREIKQEVPTSRSITGRGSEIGCNLFPTMPLRCGLTNKPEYEIGVTGLYTYTFPEVTTKNNALKYISPANGTWDTWNITIDIYEYSKLCRDIIRVINW